MRKPFILIFAFLLSILSVIALEGDTNGDNIVDLKDLILVAKNFEKPNFDEKADANSDGAVNLLDLILVAKNFGNEIICGDNNCDPSEDYNNCPEDCTQIAVCGDTICNGGETCNTCPVDCGECNQQTVTIQYSPSNEDFPNPERGFMRQSNIFLDQSLDAGKISANEPSDTVVWIYFHLENYRDPRDGKGVVLSNYQGKLLEPVGSGKGLDTVNNAFKEARKKGLKLVIRFLYIGYSGIGSTKDNPEPDAPIDLVNKHADQLKPLLQTNADVIAAVQTGFAGYWGEWHSSKYLDALDTRKTVIDTVLSMTPNDRMIQLRYPRYKQRLYGGPITDSQAYDQTSIARIGHHNDAFLRDELDGGTFKSIVRGIKITNYCDNYPGGEIPCWRDYLNKDTRFVPVGGEAGTHSSTPSQFAECSNALLQLNNMHWSFINNGYSKVTLGHWENQGCMAEIRRRLGYRLVLINAKLSTNAKPDSIFNLEFQIKNEGFASMYNPRPVYLVIKNTGARHEILLDIDPRRWESGQTYTVNTGVKVPDNVQPGTYDLALWLPDKYESIKQRPEYAARFANSGVWESGLNILTKDFNIK